MAGSLLPERISALQDSGAYPHSPASVELVQTHISYVFLADDEVFKLKKPVDLGFVDFTTLEKRQAACAAEVRLNRRGCPGSVYRGVEPLTRDGNRFRIGGEGEVVDYAVHMKRLDSERMMDRLLARGEVDLAMLGRVAARLTEMHEGAERNEHINAVAGPETVRHDWEASLATLETFVNRTIGPKRLQTLHSFGDSVLRDEAAYMQAREDAGWTRDCHGDLRSDAVCFDDSVPGGICLYDCIEFNEQFRFIDTALDAAFLAMDIEYRGYRDLSDLFIGLYAASIGDEGLPLLLHFYKAFRAVVRGKVESWLLDDAGVSKQQKAGARKRARAYFTLAERYATRKRYEGAVMVTGPSGTGKSVLAGALAARMGAVLLSTDVVRRELFGLRTGGQDGPDQGRYTPEAREQVYEAMLKKAQDWILQGRSVVIDGTYITRDRRAPMLEVIRDAGVPLLAVECFAPDEAVKVRQEQRALEGWTASEGRYDVYIRQRDEVEPADEMPESQRLVLDTTQGIGAQLEAVTSRLGPR